ncbi:hypothetical protein V2I21_08465 [Campylobacter sp. CLAX-22107-21]|uniref:hypothetical protein n=1 Tax=Campylobacter devanensis TaxID=3161138 RepID=UPI002EBE8BD8|nr:hypothetical protein [Campylobacter sp. CLAX-22107-21]
MLNLDVYRQAKSLQKTTNSQVVKVVYKNYKGLSLEVEPVELAVIKSSLGLMAQQQNNFLANTKNKYGY